MIRDRISWASAKLACSSLAPIARERPKRRTNRYVNSKAESCAAAGRGWRGRPTFDGHPLYAFVGDTVPGQAKGNGLTAAGGLWHEIPTSGTAAAAPAGGSSS